MINRILLIVMIAVLLACTSICVSGSAADATHDQNRPNIVWIIPDDMSAHFGCYGENAVETPNLARLTSRGVKFTEAHVTAPVCSTCRSAFINSASDPDQ